MLSILADNTFDVESFTRVLQYLKQRANWAPFRAQVDIMLQREFEEFASEVSNCKV